MELKFKVPQSLRDIPLHKYQAYITKENPTEEDSLKCLLDIDRQHIKHIKQDDFEFLVEQSKKLFNEETPLVRTFNLDGVTYGFIPNLDEITYGENKDITTYLTEWGQMHKAMAVLYRPIHKKIGEKYTIESYQGSHVYSERMKEMPLSIALGASVFFYTLIKDLLIYTQNYLEIDLKKMRKHSQTLGKDSQKNGEVTQNYIRLLKETLQNLNKSRNLDFTNV